MPFDKRGWEIPDPVPFATTVPMQRPPTLEETIARLVRQEVSKRAAAEGYETWEEADDFAVGEEDPSSIHELDDDQEFAPLQGDFFQPGGGSPVGGDLSTGTVDKSVPGGPSTGGGEGSPPGIQEPAQ